MSLCKEYIFFTYKYHEKTIILNKKQNRPPTIIGERFVFILIYARDTFVAAGPLSPCTTSKVTASPTFNSSNVTPLHSVEWKKRSFVSPSRAMNPNPFCVLVLIVPFIVFLFRVLPRNPTSFHSMQA